jgi:tetratricopeptide (TPR) repeat protein
MRAFLRGPDLHPCCTAWACILTATAALLPPAIAAGAAACPPAPAPAPASPTAQNAPSTPPAAAAPAALSAPAARSAPERPPLLDNLGDYHRAITIASPEAQRYFDQGLRLLFAFSLQEAQRSFEEAARLDPACASCSWGVAMSLGPHINVPAMADRTQAAHRAAEKALELAPRASPVERALAEAVAKRSSDPPPADKPGQAALDLAYADAMREVARRFPEDVDAAALFAEALMDVHPWDYWTAGGAPQPWTEEILAALEGVLRRRPDHPGANHYYIHAVEASPHPERAVAAAERLSRLMPGATHLVHMPSHVYARVGRWADASEANRRAIAADKAFVERFHPEGFYLMYAAHNHQFLWSTALMEGRAAEALQQAREAVAMVPIEMLRAMPGFDGTLEYPIWTLVRIGRFAEALREPPPPADLAYATAMWHAARGIACAASGKPAEAEGERALVSAALLSVPVDAPQGFNTSRSLLEIALPLVEGELAAARGQRTAAVKKLRAAVAAEDALRYDEPSDWYFPLRPRLGVLLLAAGSAAEAQAVCEEDLRRHPENGWALAVLAESLGRQGKAAEARQVERRLAKAWAAADLEPAAIR